MWRDAMVWAAARWGGRAVLVVLLGALASGCPAMAITMGAKTAASIIADDRSLAQQTADLELKTQIEQGLVNESAALAGRVNVDVFGGRVMLTGIVPNDADRWRAVRVARDAAGGGLVYDDLAVLAGGGVGEMATDVAINKTLGLNLLAGERIASVSLLHRVVNGGAFIMGEARDYGEIESVRSIALQTPGIDRVVTHIVVQ
jgi:osmotically-inducible protein OsmY